MSNTQQLSVVFYRYNRYSLVIILLYVLIFVSFFYYSTKMPAWVGGAGFVILIFPAIYGAIRKKSVFSLRRIDERKLTFTPTHISIGERQYAVEDLKIALYIGGFENFSYSRNNKWITRNTIYGDQNHLSFKINKKVEDKK